MAYYQSTGYPHAPGGYPSQQYPPGGTGGGQWYPHQQQGQYGGGAGRYAPSGGYPSQTPSYTPSPQMNKGGQSQSNPFINSKPPGAGGFPYQNNSGYGQDSSGYYSQQKSYAPARPQNPPAPAYAYNYTYPTSASYPTSTSYPTSASYPTSTSTPDPAPANSGYAYGVGAGQTTPAAESAASTPAADPITPLQQQAIKNWIVEKQKPGFAKSGDFNRGGGNSRFSSPGTFGNRAGRKPFPRDGKQQLANYYCEVCKVSCGTSETYHTHLNGKSHKKKQTNPLSTAPNTGKLFKCDVCDVMCTGKDAFNAHIIGTKHKKVIKLYERMGKPIPEIKNAPIAASEVSGIGSHLKKTGKPLIKFVKSAKELSTTGNDDEDENEVAAEGEEADSSEQVASGGKKKKKRVARSPRPLVKPLSTGLEGFTDAFGVPLFHIASKDVFISAPRLNPWGYSHEEIERFYVDTSLRRNRYDDFSILNVHRKIYPSEKELESLYGTLEDVEKCLAIIATKLHEEKMEELKESLQNTVPEESKLEETTEEVSNIDIKKDQSKSASQESEEGNDKSDSFVIQEKGEDSATTNCVITREQEDAARIIQGFQRVGDAAKGLNLNGSLHAELIVICSDKPDHQLLQRIVEMIPDVFSDVTKFSYQVTPRPDSAGFQVYYTQDEISCCVLVTLTSLDMREYSQAEETKAEEGKGVLDPASCQKALCQMRRTKWFQGQAFSLPSFVLVLRVLKDVSRRVPAWTCMDNWVLELLLQKVVSKSHPEYTRPGDVLRSFIACIASGCFLPGAPGISDPCERDKIDAGAQLTSQQREDLTFSAQHALRLIAFKQLHKVLGLENAPKMQDIQAAIMPPRLPIRRFVSYKNWSRAKKRTASTPDSAKKPKIEDSTDES